MELPVLYLPGRLATFITLDLITGIHGCLFYNVVHDDGWYLGNDATKRPFYILRQCSKKNTVVLLHLSLL